MTPEREAEIREHATKWLDILHPDNREGSAAATILDLLAALDAEREKVRELERGFDLRWKADQRAIKRWQAAGPDRDLIWPDHADLVVWLLGQLENQKKDTTP